jgi:hypothetical protein
MVFGALRAVGIGNSVMLPLVVMRPIRFEFCSVNQRFASDPTAMPEGARPGVGNSVKLPLVVMRPIRFEFCSVNQMFPSGPVTSVSGKLFGEGMENSVMMELAATLGGS